MLPDRCFHPLDLDTALDAAYGDGGDTKAVWTLIAEALLDPRSRGDERVFDYAWECLEFFEDDDMPAAVELMTRLIDAHPDERFALGALRASLRDPRETRMALEEITTLHTDLVALPPEERDLRFYHLAPDALAELTGDDERGGALAAEGIALAMQRGRADDADQIVQRSPGAEHRLIADEREAAQMAEIQEELETISGPRQGATPAGKRGLPPGQGRLRMVYLPEPEYRRALADDLLDATFPVDHEDYRRELQGSARDSAEIGKVSIAPIDIAGLRAFAEREDLDPARRSTRLAHVSAVDAQGDVPWPPQRNAGCWCGSGRKYKKCCGHPGFGQAPVPDRGQAVLRVELQGIDPPVWRRLAVPSRIGLASLHEALCTAMGWHGEHMYAFEIDGAHVLDPRADDDAPGADQVRLPQMANEPGQSFVWRYDFGDDWTHTVRVEEIVPVDPATNEVRTLDGDGACPPEDCGGVHGYRRLLAAASDQSHPDHHDAVEQLG